MSKYLKCLFYILFPTMLSSCQVTYVLRNSVEQMKILYKREKINALLAEDKNSNEKIKELNLTLQHLDKLKLAMKAKEFAENFLHLTPTKNYTSFVQLHRPYVVWAVSAAPKWELKNYLWWFPIVGKVPYKGFYEEFLALEEAKKFQNENYDTYVRGVAAYSTLGWFEDPILSSMLNYKDHDLVNTIIHETVHATLFIKNNTDFNERLATFLGNKGTEKFYEAYDECPSSTLELIQKENSDDRIFSEFIGKEINKLEKWYKENKNQTKTEEARLQRINQIQINFSEQILPKMQSNNYKKFASLKLNNARLLIYKTYMQDMQLFESLYQKVGNDFAKFIKVCKSFEESEDPEKAMANYLNKK